MLKDPPRRSNVKDFVRFIMDNVFRIDLFNIAFSKDAPDRETGIKAYHEIKK